MTKAQEQLIDILGNQLFGVNSDLCELDGEQLNAVMNEAKQQAVFPFVYAYIAEKFSKSDGLQNFKKQNDAFIIKSIRNLHTHNLIHQLLENNGVPYVILKGQASALYYPNPMLRPMGDVDFLVSIEDRGRVGGLLESQGFRKKENAEKHKFHWAYSKGEERAELHWAVPGVPFSADTDVNSYLSDIIEKRELNATSDASFYVPSTFHHGIVLLLHAVSHLSTTGVGLRHLCDWLVFAESMSENEFTEMYLEAFNNMGILTFAKVLTQIGVRFFGCKEKFWCSDADETVCEGLLEDTFRGGNFGVKEEGRKPQSMMIKNRKTGSIAQNSVYGNILETIRQKALQDYPVCRKYPIVSPIIWIIVIIQYLVKVAQGKKYNMLNTKNFSAAKRRHSLYAKLKLFEK